MEYPKNLHQLKKHIKVGMKLKVKYLRPDKQMLIPNDDCIRTIKKIQGNGIWLSVNFSDRERWLDWPRASDIEFKESGFIIYEFDFYDQETNTTSRMAILEYSYL